MHNTSFIKRQKELRRLEKQQQKQAKRAARAATKQQATAEDALGTPHIAASGIDVPTLVAETPIQSSKD